MNPHHPMHTILKFCLIIGLFFLSSSNSFANTDTIYASIPVGQFGSSCIDANHFPGNIQTIQNLCPDSSGVNANFIIQDPSSGCVSYFGLSEGPSLGCFEICDDQSNCDTIHIYLNIIPPTPLNFMCDTMIAPEVINVSVADCGADAAICLPMRFDIFNTLDVFDNGVAYNNGIDGCDMDTIIAYTYSNLFGQGSAGPYTVDSWIINGVEFMGEFPDMPSLLDSMNLWDTLGTWMFDTIVPFTIVGGFSGNVYGALILSKPGVSGSNAVMGANFALIPMGSEITLSLGQHLLTVVDNNTSCTDSVMINIQCLPNDSMTLDTYVGLSGSICIDTSDLIGNFTSLENVCPTSGVGVDIFPNDICVDWEALVEGVSEVCLVACDDLGFCDTTFLTLTIHHPQTDTFQIVLDENDFNYLCLDSTELIGTINNYMIIAPPSLYSLTLDTVDFCLQINSTTFGSDFACVMICDAQGGCDTTCFEITVNNPALDFPIANDDLDSTAFNTSLVLDILANDTFDLTDTISIITPPQTGVLQFIDSTNTYIYIPDPGSCGIDNFTYEICNSFGCDQATVTLYVQCEALKVYNGFSPNGDDVNDTFMIIGLEDYPDHVVHIYNRWGNRVFEGSNYQNNWDGRWKNQPLPAGNYFYLLELNDETNSVFSGMLYITY